MPGRGIGISPAFKRTRSGMIIVPDANVLFAASLQGNANDYKGTNNGTNNGATLNPTYATFVGASSQYITFNPLSTLGSGAMSQSFWIRTTTATCYVFGTNDSTNSATANKRNFACRITAGVLFIDYYSGAAGTLAGSISTVTTVNDGAWHNIILTRVAGGISTLYLDGVQKSTASIINSLGTGAGAHFTIGRFGDYATTGYYTGDFYGYSFMNITANSTQRTFLAGGALPPYTQ